ncbi:MAG: nuclear transport factor 2 family protein [Acidimicrobiales bacterium]
MTEPGLSVEDEHALRGLAAGYATSVDRRDAAGFVSVFTPDGVLRVFEPGVYDEPRSVIRGTEKLARVIERISAYDATFHFLGQATYTADGDGATGEVYCTARHLTRSGDSASDFTMLIRYRDRFVRVAGGWRIGDRAVLVDWTVDQTAVPPAPPSGAAGGGR